MRDFINTTQRSGSTVFTAAFAALSVGTFAAAPVLAMEALLGPMPSMAITVVLSLVIAVLIAALTLAHRRLREQRLSRAASTAGDPTDDRLAVLFHSVPVAMMVVRLSDGHVVEVNSAFSDLWGYTRQEACGHTSAELNLWIEPKQLIQQLKANRHADAQEFQIRCKSGQARDGLVSVAMVHFEGTAHLLVTAADVTDRRQAREMSHMAHHDTLTALPNRLWLLKALRDREQHETSGVCALLYIDLDRFKAVNDTFGHHAGDELLQLAAQRMQSRLRGTDTLVRLGGDEFVALLEGLHNARDAEHIAAGIVQHISMPFHLTGGREAYIGASIGISLVTRDTADVEELISHADTALYAAKAAGRSTVRIFGEPMADRA